MSSDTLHNLMSLKMPKMFKKYRQNKKTPNSCKVAEQARSTAIQLPRTELNLVLIQLMTRQDLRKAAYIRAQIF